MRAWFLLPDGRLEVLDGLALDLAAESRAAADRDALLWVELDHPDHVDFTETADSLGLHPLAVEDAVHARDRPKLDLYDDQHFVSLVTLRLRGADAALDVGRVMIFLGRTFVVTVRQEAGDTLERARAQLRQEQTAAPTSLDVLHAVVDTVVEDLTGTSGQIERMLLASADRLFAPERSDEAQALYQVTRHLLAMAHAVQPLIEPLRHLSDATGPEPDVELARRFQDVLDHALVLEREVSGHSQLLEHLRGSNDSRIGLQQNTDMRRIAAWAAVIAVPTAITGFYGMNVPYPGFGEVSGVISALLVQVTLAVALILLFRRRKWL